MNWRHFFGWTLAVVLALVDLCCILCLVFAYRYSHPAGESSVQVAAVDTVAIPESEKFSIVVAGDAMMHMPQLSPAYQGDGEYCFDECFRYIAPILSQYDASVVNLETTLPGGGYSGYPRFGAPDAFAKSLQKAGFDVFMMANNHCCDKDRHGIQRTLSVLDSMGVRHLGVYRDTMERDSIYPLVIEQHGIRIALLNFTYGTNGLPVPRGCVVNQLDTARILSDIDRAKELGADVIVAMPHWGEEYHLRPVAGQRWWAKWLLAHGVDHIVGSHPHVIEPVEVERDSAGEHVVAYSLGNFISSQLQTERSTSLLVGLRFEKDSSGVRLVQHDVIQTWVSRPRISGHRQSRVYPMDYPEDSLNAAERSFRDACRLPE